jgi:hypothetical protein
MIYQSLGVYRDCFSMTEIIVRVHGDVLSVHNKALSRVCRGTDMSTIPCIPTKEFVLCLGLYVSLYALIVNTDHICCGELGKEKGNYVTGTIDRDLTTENDQDTYLKYPFALTEVRYAFGL